MISCPNCSHTWKHESEYKEPFFCNECGWNQQTSEYIPMNYKSFYSELYEGYSDGTTYHMGADDYIMRRQNNEPEEGDDDLYVRSVKISDILERSIPTSPDKWAQAKALKRKLACSTDELFKQPCL
jgi:hypothetical protein